MRFFSEAANFLWFKLLLLALVLGMVVAGPKTRKTALLALVAFPIANAITDVFKHAVPVHRPFQVDLAVILRMGPTESMGTASAHSANMAAVAFVFTYYLGWWGAPWVVIAIMTGISRSYNGVHYPSQVALGWLCGIFAGFVVTKSWETWAGRHKAVSMETEPQEP